MPMPKPNQDESQQDFIGRCLGDSTMLDDYPEQDQRLAVCFGQWNDNKMAGFERKSFTGLELKKDKPGSFIARIATLNVIDKDGDVTLPGAFPEGKSILISAYMHGSWQGALPAGKAIIHEKGDEVLVEGEFNLNSESGKEHYETVKFAPDLQEWSYGFIPQEFEMDAQFEGNKVKRILKKLDVFEASPVLRGAGMNTATLGIKSLKAAIPFKETPKAPEGEAWDGAAEVAAASVEDLAIMCAWVDSANKENKGAYKLPHHKAAGQHSVVWKAVAAAMAALLGGRGGVDIPAGDKHAVYTHLAGHYKQFEKEPPEFHKDNAEGMTFADQAETVLAAVNGLVDRTKSLADLRQKDGRALSLANRERIKKLAEQLVSLRADLDTLLAEPEPPSQAEIERLFLRFQKQKNELSEVLN